MRRVRVLVVDDSAAVRRVLAQELAADDELEVVGTAASGAIALAKLAHVGAHVVTLDVEMGGESGIATLAELRVRHPDVAAVMFSAHTARGATATIDALLSGACDYVAKPSGADGLDAALAVVHRELIPKIKACGARRAGVLRSAEPVTAPPAVPARPGPVELVAIGASTGGPNALVEVLPALPRDLAATVLVVQHVPPDFSPHLARALAARCALPLAEATGGERLAAGRAWLAPGDRHLALARGASGELRLRLHQGPPENSCRPSVDVTLRSAAEHLGPRVLGVVLTGMGQDGLRGAEAIRGAGGRILAQDEATSVVWGMPGAVAKAGLASDVLPLARIASEIARIVALGRGGVA